jgi:hypothetical protein
MVLIMRPGTQLVSQINHFEDMQPTLVAILTVLILENFAAIALSQDTFLQS